MSILLGIKTVMILFAAAVLQDIGWKKRGAAMYVLGGVNIAVDVYLILHMGS